MTIVGPPPLWMKYLKNRDNRDINTEDVDKDTEASLLSPQLYIQSHNIDFGSASAEEARKQDKNRKLSED